MSADSSLVVDFARQRTWIGHAPVSEQQLAPFPAQPLTALLDLPESCQDGVPLSLPSQWLYFLQRKATVQFL